MTESLSYQPTESQKKRLGVIEGREDLTATKVLHVESPDEAGATEDQEKRNVLVITRDPGSANALIPVMEALRRDPSIAMNALCDGRAEENLRRAFPVEDRTPSGMALESAKVIGTPDVSLVCSSAETGLETFGSATYEEVPSVVLEDMHTAAHDYLQKLTDRGLPFPEKICVMDEDARDMIVTKFPHLADRVEVTGQPSFDRFAKENTAEIARQVKEKLGLSPGEKLVTWMSQYGMEELTRAFAQELGKTKDPFAFVFRRHPRDNVSYDDYKKMFEEVGVRVVDTHEFTTDQIAAASDIVATAFSTEGMNGILRGKPTVHLIDRNYLSDETIGNVQLPLPPVKRGATVGLDSVEGVPEAIDALLDPESELNARIREGMEEHYPSDGKNAERVAEAVRDVLAQNILKRELQEREENVMERIREISHEKVKPLLDAESEVKPDAGIIIVPLTDVQSVELEPGVRYDYYAARVLPHSPDHPNFVNPHLHEHGQEPYRFLQGTDMEMNTGRVQGNRVEWAEPQVVQAGEEFVIGEGVVHSLRNNGTTPVDFVFACPKSHITTNTPETPDGDRYFTKDLENGLPPQYEQ